MVTMGESGSASRARTVSPPDIDPTAMRDYWAVYEAQHDALNAELVRIAAAHPEFGPVFRSMSGEQIDAQNRASYERLRAAIVDGAWEPYDADLRVQGVAYARMGVSFEGWHDLLRPALRFLVPHLIAAYGSSPERLSAAIQAAMNVFDRSTGILGAAYLDANEERIQRQREVAEQHARALLISELSLRHQTQILQSVLNSMGDAVVVCEPEGRILLVNHAARRILGVRAASTTMDEWASLPGMFRADRQTPFPRDELPLVRALQGIASDDVEMFIQNTDAPGGMVLSVTGRPLDDSSGAFRGGLVVCRDITERRRLEEEREKNRELEEQGRRIETANRLKSEFLANMSHELRTPLNAIIGFAELMHDGLVGEVSPQHREYLGDILASGRHLLRLINDVLDLAKVESGKIDLRPEPIDLRIAVSEVCDIVRTLAAARRIMVESSVDPTLVGIVIDPAKLKQILYNYLSNALKFTPEEGRVGVRVTPHGQNAFRIEVEDTGVGIRAKDMSRLFGEFQQLDSSLSKKHAGTGLGLALTRRLVEAQGGTVGVRSEPGVGSVFEAVLPRVAPGYCASTATRGPATTPPGAPAVLVIEDDVADRDWLQRTLSEAGYAVETASTGAEAIARCRARVFDALTLDVLLPDASGLDVLREIRATTANRYTPVVMVTVVAERLAVTGFAVHDFFTKPVEATSLLASLEAAGVAPGGARPVLVIDDDPNALKLIEAMLTRLGYRTVTAHDGESGLLAADREQPGAVVLDLLMPGIGGFGFLERFRRTEQGRAMPVVVWTVKDLNNDEAARLRASAQAVVQKRSGGTATLLDALRDHLPRPRCDLRSDGHPPTDGGKVCPANRS